MVIGSGGFVLAIILMSFIAWIITTAIRARHGYPVENEWGGLVNKADAELKRQNEGLAHENHRLRENVARLEDRMAVLERIVTDAPARLSADIEKLR